jgi:hypothetical protein
VNGTPPFTSSLLISGFRILQNSTQNPAGRETNVVQTLEQQFCISTMQLNVVLRCRSRFESDGLRDYIRYRLRFGFPDGLRRGGPPRLVVQDFVRLCCPQHKVINVVLKFMWRTLQSPAEN